MFEPMSSNAPPWAGIVLALGWVGLAIGALWMLAIVRDPRNRDRSLSMPERLLLVIAGFSILLFVGTLVTAPPMFESMGGG